MKIDAYKIDIQEVSNNEGTNSYRLLYNGKPLKTPKNLIVEHSSSRLLKHIKMDALRKGKLDLSELSPYSLYCTQKDFVEQEDPIAKDIENLLIYDPLFYRCAGPEQIDQLSSWHFVLEWLDMNNLLLPSLPHSLTEDSGKVYWDELKESTNFHELTKLIQSEYNALRPEQKTAVLNLINVNESGLLLAMSLVTMKCSGEEYAEALVNAICANTIVWSSEIEDDTDKLKNFVSDVDALRKDAYTCLEYIAHYYDESQNEILKLINEGESELVEFKSTLRTNLHTQNTDKKMEREVLKTICAFLNTKGGDLLIGVNDSGEVLGIANDNFENEDKFSLHLQNILRTRLKPYKSNLIYPKLIEVMGKSVCKITVVKSNEPVYMIDGNTEDFFVRTGPSTLQLSISDAIKYAQDNFFNKQ